MASLLGHYWTPADSPEVRAQVAGDWLADLQEFPASVVAEACQQWRRSESKRPTPADIRKRCFDYMPHKPSDRPRHDHQAGQQVAAVESARYAEAATARQRFAEERGFKNFDEVIAYGIQRAGHLPIIDPSNQPRPPVDEMKS